ncbi:hypothetical protein IAG11_17980, partial [Acinetobacter baumannii]|nr:hypothetical protein [Acinetobacter baumannii]
MTMNNLEYEAVIECEKIKGKAAIAVAILSNCGGHGVMDLSELSRDNLLKYIKEVQA